MGDPYKEPTASSDRLRFAVTTFRAPKGTKIRLVKLAEVSGRSLSWLVSQAVNQMFRELEEGVITSLHVAEEPPAKKTLPDMVQSNFDPTTWGWLTRFKARTGLSWARILRFATRRYLAKREHIWRGAPYQDPLAEPGPRLPPP